MNHEPSGPAPIARGAGDTISESTRAIDAPNVRERRKRNRLLFNKKREQFLKDYLRSIDVVIYAELATIYYMDCSFTRFFIRALVQFMFFTPKPQYIPEPPQNRPYIGAIFGSNLLCIFFHIFNDRPAAGEATRGYMHGGLAMDFIGQKGPASKLHLVVLDVLIVLLQLVALGTHVTQVKVKKQASTLPTTLVALAQPHQDLDHEERGIHRSDHEPVDVELQTLNSSGRQASTGTTDDVETTSVNDPESNNEHDSLLASPDMQPRSDAHIFDAFNSGEIIIADLDIITLLRTQIAEYHNNPSVPLPATPAPTLSERLARGGLNFRLRIGDRIAGV